MMIAGGFTCQRYGFNVGADKFSLLTIENGKNKHYAPIGMDIDFPKPKISLRQAARNGRAQALHRRIWYAGPHHHQAKAERQGEGSRPHNRKDREPVPRRNARVIFRAGNL